MEEPEPPRKLDYNRDLSPSGNAIIAHAVCGTLTTCVVTIIIATLLILLVAATSGAMAIVAVPVGICYVAGAISFGRKLYRNPVYRGWGMGIWIGLGLAALLQGGCFIIISR